MMHFNSGEEEERVQPHSKWLTGASFSRVVA